MDKKQLIRLGVLAVTVYVCTVYVGPAVTKWKNKGRTDPAVERANFLNFCAELVYSRGVARDKAETVKSYCGCITEKIDKKFDWADTTISASETGKHIEIFSKECAEEL